MGDRFGREQGLLERLGRGDVGLGRALAHGDADARAGQIDPAAGDDHVARDQIVDHFRGQDRKIAGRPGLELLDQAVGGAPGDGELRAAGALERRDDIEHHRFHAIGAENFHLAFLLPRRRCPSAFARFVGRISVA